MIPTTIVTLERLPLAATGKLDHNALPVPDPRRQVSVPSAVHPTRGYRLRRLQPTLDIERIGVDDGFFALGGTSLAATGLLAGSRSPPVSPCRSNGSSPIRHPNRWPVASRAASTACEGRTSMNRISPRRCRSCCPCGPAEPNRHCSVSTQRSDWLGVSVDSCSTSIPSVPSKGCNPRLTDATVRFDTLDQLAARYVQEIRSVQPHGPYHLLGYSLGGTIAHAIAVQLRRDGDSVATLAMMDTRVVTADSFRAPTPSVAAMLAEFGGFVVPDGAAELTVEAATELLHQQGGLFTAVTAEHLESLQRDYTRLVDLTWNHRPALFDGELIYFSAADSIVDEVPSPARAWSDHVTGRITEHRIPIQHERMTDPDSLRTIGVGLTEHFRSTHTEQFDPASESPQPTQHRGLDHESVR